MCSDIDKNDWEKFQQALYATFLVTDGNPRNRIPGRSVAYNIDALLDVVAERDVRFFRPKAVVMRMDMPGEEKYGLDFMDLFYKNYIINASRDRWSRKYHRGVQKGKALKKRQKHIDSARGRACSTRIVLDPVEIWQNTTWPRHVAGRHGLKCPTTQKIAKLAHFPLPTSQPNGLFSGDARLRLRARNDRYPPSTISTMTDSEDRRITLNRNIRLTRGRSGMDTVHAASGFQRKIQWTRDMEALYIDVPFSRPMVCHMWLPMTAILLVWQLL
jgi:hypothetical protein